jgi:hypothetical protein
MRIVPSRRRLLLLILVLLVPLAAYMLWSPGLDVRDGRHDRGANGLWMQHGWLGDDAWFRRNDKESLKAKLRDPAFLAATAADLRTRHIRDLFPHLCPCSSRGEIAPVDDAQIERFLDAFAGFRVMPWVGGVRDADARVSDAKWRATFVQSCLALLQRHPRLAGLHLNIEPMPDGDPDFIRLLDELNAVRPKGSVVSIAAYPPPTIWQRRPEVHWGNSYFSRVAARCEQMVVMLYDTGLHNRKFFTQLTKDWTLEALDWSPNTNVLLGVPAYDDAGVDYHDPDVENITNSLAGIHAALHSLSPFPGNYQGIALYSEWEMTPAKWRDYETRFMKPPAPGSTR